jgi:hypothetical protein
VRTATITDLSGNPLGSITETDEGHLEGEGKGESLVSQAPTKTFDDWVETTRHSKYLRIAESE